MIQKAAALRYVNLDSAIQLDNKIVQECKALTYKHGELRATIDLAYAYKDKEDYTMAKKNLDEAGEFLKTSEDSFAFLSYYNEYGAVYMNIGKLDSSLVFFKKAIVVIPSGLAVTWLPSLYGNIGNAYLKSANFPDALTYYQKALSIGDKVNNEQIKSWAYSGMADALYEMEDRVKAKQYCLYAIKFAERVDDKFTAITACNILYNVYNRMHKYSEAYAYAMKGEGLAKTIADLEGEAVCLSDAAEALAKLNKFEEAKKLDRKSMIIADSSNLPSGINGAYAAMGEILKMENKNKEAIPFYEKSCRQITGSDLYDLGTADDYDSLSDCYEKTGNYSKALEAYKTARGIRDSLKNMENIRKATELAVSYDFKKKQELAKDVQDKKDADAKRLRTQQYFIIAGLVVFVLAFIAIAIIQLRNNKQKQKANILLESQKQKVESTLSELKSAQAQLIQSEKMASLGELTAGIAHEIQNPLNFVNNFSEINKELLIEIKDEIEKANYDEVKTIISDVMDNEEKIMHHGKRADAIVKGMLQHSRKNTGQKEATDINALCDEYLRLSYHGLRAKDKAFNADFKMYFDETLGKINIVPQDIGRVLLNLFNNAFYAVNERKKLSANSYQPLVSVHIKRINDKVEITVSDNGNGIPQSVIDKIFQPFFTTKPTGEGTGLGLSLSYDIIIKEHGGTIRVESEEGEGSRFIIQLPVE